MRSSTSCSDSAVAPLTIPRQGLRDQQGRSPDEFSVYNVMLPRTYYPRWQGNLFERRCRAIANQLQGGDMDVDFDQVCSASTQECPFMMLGADCRLSLPSCLGPQCNALWLRCHLSGAFQRLSHVNTKTIN